jgi:hypothetical protein
MPTSIPSAWTDLLQQFFPLFTAPVRPLFLHLLTGWVLCTARRTVTGILPFADAARRRPHDAYHRFFRDARWDPQALWRTLAGILVRAFYPDGIILLDLDDTVFHRTGRKVDGAGWWRDAVRSTATHVVHAWGLNLVIVTLRVTGPWGAMPLGLPIHVALHRKGGPSTIYLARKMLADLSEWFPHRSFRVHADGFYACMAGILPARVHLISRMRRDAVLYGLPPKRHPKRRGRRCKKGRRLGAPEQMAAHVRSWKRVTTTERGRKVKRLLYARLVVWYRVSQTPLLLVISRDPRGREKDDFFFTTDVTLTAAEVVGGYAGRWCIEETIKNTKQHLGAQQPQTWKRQGPERAAAIGLLLHSLVWLWYHGQRRGRHAGTRWFRLRPWYPAKCTPSFADALAALRRSLWRPRINAMFEIKRVHDKNIEFLIDALASAA